MSRQEKKSDPPITHKCGSDVEWVPLTKPNGAPFDSAQIPVRLCPLAARTPRPAPWSHSLISPHGPAPCVPTRVTLCMCPPACPRSLSVCPLAGPETGTVSRKIEWSYLAGGKGRGGLSVGQVPGAEVISLAHAVMLGRSLVRVPA